MSDRPPTLDYDRPTPESGVGDNPWTLVLEIAMEIVSPLLLGAVVLVCVFYFGLSPRHAFAVAFACILAALVILFALRSKR